MSSVLHYALTKYVLIMYQFMDTSHMCVGCYDWTTRFPKEGSQKYQLLTNWKNFESELFQLPTSFLTQDHHPHTPPPSPPSHISFTSSLSLLHHLPHTPPSPPPSHTSSSSLSHLHHLLPYTPPPPRVQPDYVSLSFPTISSSGPNGAIIHYKCVREEGRKGVCAISEGVCV